MTSLKRIGPDLAESGSLQSHFDSVRAAVQAAARTASQPVLTNDNYEYYPLPGQADSLAFPFDMSEAIPNDTGDWEIHIVGYQSSIDHAMLWIKPFALGTPYSYTIDLHNLLPGVFRSSIATAVSRNIFPSLVVGAAWDGGGSQAVIWEKNISQGLPKLPQGGPSAATGVSDTRQVVGWAVDAAGTRRAAIWEEIAGTWTIRDLGGVSGGGASEATAIGPDGSRIVGWSVDPDDRPQPVLWRPNLTVLPVPNWSVGGEALGVSGASWMAGISRSSVAFSLTLWSNTTLQALDAQAMGGGFRDINRRGDVLATVGDRYKVWQYNAGPPPAFTVTDVSDIVAQRDLRAYIPVALEDHLWIAGVGLTPEYSFMGFVAQSTYGQLVLR
jgi:hypothetical protein